MRVRNLVLAPLLAATTIPGAALAAWSQGYVVDYYLAPGWASGEKDINCPNGNLPQANWAEFLKTPWRTEEEVLKMTANGGLGFGTPLSNRGPKPGQNVHRDPTLIPDPQMPFVRGNVGYGFDLDNNPATGFTSPDGKEKGLDNQVYRAVGCHDFFRGGGRYSGARREAEEYDLGEMMSGAYTVLIMLSGEGNDPRNDGNMRVGFYLSKEQIAKDALGGAARDYSYRIDPDPRFMTVFDAASVNGVVKPRAPLQQMKIREYNSRQQFPQDLTLEKPQVRLTLNDNGTLFTEVGGYRDWRYMYMGFASGGNPAEIASGLQTPSLWYNWEKAADWKLPGTAGPNTYISSFYTMDAVPAFIITPDTNQIVTRAEVFTGVSKVAQETPQSLAIRTRSGTGGDPSFRLEGGAAVWPLPPSQAKPMAAGDPLGWSKLIQNPAGGLAVLAGKAPLDPTQAQATTPATGFVAATSQPGPRASIR